MSKQIENRTVHILLVVAFVTLALILFILLDSIKNQNQQQHLRTATERYQLAYNTIYSQYKQLATNLHTGITTRFGIQDIYRKLLTANENEKTKLRQKLLIAIKPRFEELRKEANIRQIQFHLPNNESFLRAYRPEKFGDNLSAIRETVSYVNREHIAIDGFEEGRVCAGYRFVFPITGTDQNHLGSMEITFGPEALTSAMMKQYFVLSNFFISKEKVQNKLFPGEDNLLFTPSPHPGQFHDKNVLAALEKISREKLQKLNPTERTIKVISDNAYNGMSDSYYAPSIGMLITSLPVLNPVTHEQIAYLTIRSQSDLFTKEIRHFRIVLALSLILFTMIFTIFTLLYDKKRILEGNTRQLVKQKQRLLLAQEIGNTGDWVLDLKTNQLSWSDQIYHIFGQQPEDFPATYESFLERVHPDDRDFVDSSYLNSLKDRKPYDIEHRIISQDGTEKWVREICKTEYDEGGTPLYSRGIVHDITRQRNTLMTLQQERDRFMNGPVMTFTWENSKNWPVTQVSANVSDLLGYSAEEFLDNSVIYSTCIHPNDLQRVTEEVRQNTLPGNRCHLHKPYRLIHRNGKSIWVLNSTTLIQNEQGQTTHYQGYLVDITKMIQMEEEVLATKNRLKKHQQEEELKRCESLKAMAGAIAHRFNNAMTAVQGNLDLIALTADDDSNEYRMAREGAQAARGASQVGSMLLCYVGKQPLRLQKLPFFKLVKECITSLENLQQSYISLTLTRPPQEIYCWADTEQIKEVLESILSNAVESLDKKPGSVEVCLGSDYFSTDSFHACFQSDTLQDGNYSFCRITDSGHGIDPEELSRVFEPFYTTRFVGRGLGLALTVGIMRSHSGAITVESSPGGGTTVQVLLPSIPSDQQPEEKTDQAVRLSGNIFRAEDKEMRPHEKNKKKNHSITT